MELKLGILAIALASLILLAGCTQTGGSASTAPPTTNSLIAPPAQSGNANAEAPPAPPDGNSGSAQVKEFAITATNFQFAPSTITVKKGDRVKITLTNSEGIHGIAIPDFGVNIQPGDAQTATAEFTADKTGAFEFRCNIPCGPGHKEMTGTLVVE